MEDFEMAWERIAISRDGEDVSMELHPLLGRVYDEFINKPADLHAIKVSLENLLLFLSTSPGRTNANCFATDLFFCLSDWDDDVNRERFPEPLTDIIGHMGGALHDTVSNPETAKNFNGLPEQLLELLRAWNPE
jgi:hypothetical protein